MDNNQSLAVKYRPQKFEDLVGQDVIKSILCQQIRSNKIKSAYLFSGVVGSGKTTAARIFANSISKGEIVELDAASHNGVDDVRELIEQSKKMPLHGKYKVFICDEVQNFSKSAWDCMLKLLEEPPITSVFIMCTTELQKVPITIQSRLQIFVFNRITDEVIVERLKHICFMESQCVTRKEALHYDIDALRYIASESTGSMRKAITLLEQCISYSNKVTSDVITDMLGIVSIKDCISLYSICLETFDKMFVEKIIEIVDRIDNKGISMKVLIDKLLEFSFSIFKLKLMKINENTYDDKLKYIGLVNSADLKYFYLFNCQDKVDVECSYKFTEFLKKLSFDLKSVIDKTEYVKMAFIEYVYKNKLW